jgi:hypothetical protein
MELFTQIRFALFCATICLFGCATDKFDTSQATEFLVKEDHGLFYLIGPAQERGPDASLRHGERVKMLRREFGYSYVTIADGRSGYIANEALALAPAPKLTEPASPSRKRSARVGVSLSPDAVSLSSPLEIEPLPEPVDVIHPISEMDSSADAKPDFRY